MRRFWLPYLELSISRNFSQLLHQKTPFQCVLLCVMKKVWRATERDPPGIRHWRWSFRRRPNVGIPCAGGPHGGTRRNHSDEGVPRRRNPRKRGQNIQPEELKPEVMGETTPTPSRLTPTRRFNVEAPAGRLCYSRFCCWGEFSGEHPAQFPCGQSNPGIVIGRRGPPDPDLMRALTPEPQVFSTLFPSRLSSPASRHPS